MLQIPEDPALVVTELEKAKLQPIPRSVARKRVAPPPKEKSRKRQRIRLDTATNVHMPELIQGTGLTYKASTESRSSDEPASENKTDRFQAYIVA